MVEGSGGWKRLARNDLVRFPPKCQLKAVLLKWILSKALFSCVQKQASIGIISATQWRSSMMLWEEPNVFWFLSTVPLAKVGFFFFLTRLHSFQLPPLTGKGNARLPQQEKRAKDLTTISKTLRVCRSVFVVTADQEGGILAHLLGMQTAWIVCFKTLMAN